MKAEVREKLAKVYELVNRGATEGERKAAQAALDRLVDKYNVTPEQLENIDLIDYRFTYASDMEMWLLDRIFKIIIEDRAKDKRRSYYNPELGKRVRNVKVLLTYIDYVTVEAAYEYFRRHMKSEWNRLCAPKLRRCWKPKRRNKLREQLQSDFFSQYVIKSNLYKDEELYDIDLSKLSQEELQRKAIMAGVRGGEYNRQVITGNLLEA